MARIDTSTIDGYENMTAEQKLAALEGLELPDPDYTGYVKKDVFDKTASEHAKLKKQYNALLSEDEQKKQAADEELQTLREKVAEMEQRETIATHKAQFISLGYEEKLAEETAKAMAAGDINRVFANQKKFLEAHDKAYKAQLMSSKPQPPAGDGTNGGTLTLDAFRKLPLEERAAFANKHPDEYAALYGSNNDKGD